MSPEEFRMSLLEHLSELRTRLSRVTLAVLALGAFSLLYARELYGLLMRPVLQALPPESAQLVYTSAIEEFNVLMKIGLYAGIFLSTPVLLWQVWAFVAPGLYDSERKLAGPFIVFGTLAFLAGALFCYLVLLPSMFTFLLQREEVRALQAQVVLSQQREADALRYLTLGEPARALASAQAPLDALARAVAGGTAGGMLGSRQQLRPSAEAQSQLEAFGRLADAVAAAGGPAVRSEVVGVLALHEQARAHLEAGAPGEATRALDEAAGRLALVLGGAGEAVTATWNLQRRLAEGLSTAESLNWTKPMLSMHEQLSLVLVLELAFGLIFELPLVMMVLGMVGLVSAAFLFRYQRHALVVCLIAAALITPTGDAVNLALMAGPMLACYELGILLVWLVERRRAAQPQAEATPAA